MYVDSSILVKLLVREPGSEESARSVAGAVLVSSEIAYGEVWSALLRKEASGDLKREWREAAWSEFLRQLGEESIRLLRFEPTTILTAVDLMGALYPSVLLRTLDAIHLATFQGLGGEQLFTSDRRMQAACASLQLPWIGL